MASKQDPIAVYEMDDDKKPTVTRYALEKMLKDIKAALPKHRKIKITIEKSN
jgi:hypothetical protein